MFLPAIVDLEHLHRQLVPVFSQIIGHCENIFLRNVTHAPIPAAPAVNRFFRQVYTRNLGQPAVFALLGGSPRAERQQNLVRRTYLARLDQHFAHIAEDFEFHRSPFGADMEIDIRHQADGRHRNAFTTGGIERHIVAVTAPCPVGHFHRITARCQVFAVKSLFYPKRIFRRKRPLERSHAARLHIGRGQHPVGCGTPHGKTATRRIQQQEAL